MYFWTTYLYAPMVSVNVEIYFGILGKKRNLNVKKKVKHHSLLVIIWRYTCPRHKVLEQSTTVFFSILFFILPHLFPQPSTGRMTQQQKLFIVLIIIGQIGIIFSIDCIICAVGQLWIFRFIWIPGYIKASRLL